MIGLSEQQRRVAALVVVDGEAVAAEVLVVSLNAVRAVMREVLQILGCDRTTLPGALVEADRRAAAPLEPQDLLLPVEAAAIAGVSTRTLRRWAVAGRVESQKTIGGHWRYVAESVRAQAQPRVVNVLNWRPAA